LFSKNEIFGAPRLERKAFFELDENEKVIGHQEIAVLILD
jgi:hypothetical protein